jgi:hypothetical protein
VTIRDVYMLVKISMTLSMMARLGDLARRLNIDYSGWFDHKRLCDAAKRLTNETEGIFSEELPVSRDAAIHTWASNQVEQFLTGTQGIRKDLVGRWSAYRVTCRRVARSANTKVHYETLCNPAS